MQDALMQQGVDLMLFGMGSVFVFLTVLVFATTVMSAVIQRFLPEAETPIVPAAPAGPVGVNDPKLVAIIQAAIDQHRKK